jgi:hypothetical protein
MRALFSLVCLATTTLLLTGCGGDEERYEDIEKLRAFGSSTLPVISEPSTDAAPKFLTITVFAAVPLGDSVTAEPYEDEAKSSVLTLPTTIVPGSEKYEEHAAFRIYSVQATQPVPPATIFDTAKGAPFVRLQFGIRLVSGVESENIVGSSLIYPAGAPELTRTAPTISIAKPALPDVSGTEDLEATVTDSAAENMRIGWFASDGEIKSRRARITEWETPSAGPATLIVTARGMKTGAFAFKVMDVNVQ